MNKVVVVVHSNPGLNNEKTHGLDELNALLAKGWTIKRTDQMSAAVGGNAANAAAFALAYVLDDGNTTFPVPA